MRYLILVAILATPLRANSQTCDADDLRRALTQYEVGRVSETTDILRPCLPAGFRTSGDRVQAWRLMALSSIALDSLVSARIYVRSLLRADSRYRPDPLVDPPRFVTLVSDVKPKWYTWPWTGRRWYHWAGRAAIVGTVVAVPLFLVDGPLPALPEAPGWPERN